jgi:spore maturation protein SpmA
LPVNSVFLVLVAAAFAVAAGRDLLAPGDAVMAAVGKAAIDEAGRAVTLALGLVGVMALFLGLMRVAERAGLLTLLARLLRRPLERLFPEVPAGHPAMGAMLMNIAANMLGLGNAATPFGLRAMQALDSLNPCKGTASNAMVLFLAINTASVTLLPTSVIALRAAAGSVDPAGVVPTTLFATLVSTGVAIVVARLGDRLWPLPSSLPPPMPAAGAAPAEPAALAAAEPAAELGIGPATAAPAVPELAPAAAWQAWLALLLLLGLAAAALLAGDRVGPWLIPALITLLVAYGAWRRVPVYEALVEGGREGFPIAVRIVPYLVAILVAIGMLRASGAMAGVIEPLARLTQPFGVPAEALIMAALRSLSGSGAFAYLASLLNDPAIGPDSYTGYLVSTIQASTETTFYVLAVYCGAVGVRRMRHALVAGLAADLAGLVAAAFICRTLYG